MRVFRNILILLLVLAPVTAYSLNVREYILDNGLKVLIAEDHKATTATFQVWYRSRRPEEGVAQVLKLYSAVEAVFRIKPHYP